MMGKGKLTKKLLLIDIFSIATGAMISSGLFILPGLAYNRAGPAMVVSYFLAGLLAATGMFSEAELVSAMPRAGGGYFYVTRSMGPAVGTVNGLITWFSLSLKSAFALVGMAAFTVYIVPINIHIIAVMFCLVFLSINLLGVKEASTMQVVLVLGLLGVLLFFIIRGIPFVKVSNFEPFMPQGVISVISTAGFVFISYGGLLKVSSVAEETHEPAKIVPAGMILSILFVNCVYFFVVFVVTGILGQTLGKVLAYGTPSLTPISDAAYEFMGEPGRVLLSIAAILAFVSTANAGIMAASRYPLALSRDGLLPKEVGKISSKFHTPYIAILITGGCMMVSLFLKLDLLIKVASAVLLLSYILSCLSVIIMRESHLQNYQPKFRTPLYPWIQIIGIVGFGFLLFEMGKEVIFIVFLLILSGLFVYWFYGKIRATREYALLHLIERITAKELTTRLLESELKEIIRERDEIVEDRFDTVIENAMVLDITRTITLKELFELIAEKVSKRVSVSRKQLLELLWQREKESSTAISPTLAIPHIVIDGENIFDIVLIRVSQGVRFSQEHPNVRALFVLVGTRDERNFHLRALAAIAQIVQTAGFDKSWLKARNEHELKDIILLGERRRYNDDKK